MHTVYQLTKPPHDLTSSHTGSRLRTQEQSPGNRDWQGALGTGARATVPHLRRSEGLGFPRASNPTKGKRSKPNSTAAPPPHVHGWVGGNCAQQPCWPLNYTMGMLARQSAWSSPHLGAFRKIWDLFVLWILIRHQLNFLDIRIGASVLLGPNPICVAFKLRIPVQNPCPRKVPELALFSFQSSGPSSLPACSSFFPFPSQYMISSELGGKKPILLLV